MLPEAEICLDLFDDMRRSAAEAVGGLPAEALNWRPLEGTNEATNSLAVTCAHVTGSQRYWVGEVVGGRDARRVRAAEFRASAVGAAELVEQMDAAFALLREVLAAVPPGHLDEVVTAGERTVTRRWGLLHALEHTALHVGHMQLTRQLWDSRSASR